MTSQNLSPWELRRWKKGFIHSFTETRRKSCLIYKPINKSLFEEGQKQKLATKDTEEKQRSQRKILRSAGFDQCGDGGCIGAAEDGEVIAWHANYSGVRRQ